MPTDDIQSDQTTDIRRLNDALRNTATGGRILITRGIRALPPDQVRKILLAVKTYDAFTEDNDPYKEHDFGSDEIDGTRIFWKIDYYDRTLSVHSPDASDPTVTERVLTIMLAEEW
jgi:hypothetical protein